MGFFSDLFEPGKPGVLDTRDPEYVSFYHRALSEPDFGFGRAFRPGLQDPSYKRAGERYGEGVSGAYSSRGFGSLRTGPAAFQHAQGLREMEEGRAAQEADLGLRWAQMIAGWPGGSGGQQAYTPGPSPFASLLGPVAGAYGKRLGENMPLNPFAGLWGGGGNNYTPGNYFGSPGTMFT